MARLSDKLSDRGHNVTLIDSEKQIILKNSISAKINKLTLKKSQPIVIDCDYVIAFASHLSILREYVCSSRDCKVLFWSVHPLNAIYLMPRYGEKIFQMGINFLKITNWIFFKSEDNVRKKVLNSLIEQKAFVCMDAENSRMLDKYYGIAEEVSFVPVPVEIPSEVKWDQKNEKKQFINVIWYGRLCDFKVYGLIYLISEMGKLKNKFKINLIIIGDGSLRYLVEGAVASAGISANFRGSMPNLDAKNLINSQADIVFAMGTAALEAAAMGIPTILADASYSRIDFAYKFSWLYQTKQFTLGRFINRSTPVHGYSISEIMQEIQVRRNVHAKASFEYVKQNHEINTVASLIEKACCQSSMLLSNFSELTVYRRPMIIRLAKKFRKLTKQV